jgi:hypothetical protein
VVKAFHSIGREVMANPRFGDRRAELWMRADDAAAGVVGTREFGWGMMRR